MVWFQCEVCGDELKKPKLPNHFRQCSAYKLSCIDCGQTFDQQGVQAHTQCITEAEKYGPKGQAKPASGTPAKPSKVKPDVDTNVGLSERPPWFCSLCNTQATSKQALLLHADGKKHRAKARAYAAKQQPNPPVEASVSNKDSVESAPNNEAPKDKSTENDKENGLSNGASGHDESLLENGNISVKKRKSDMSNDSEKCANEVGYGTINLEKETPKKIKKARQDLEVKGEENKRAKYVTDEEAKKGITSTKKEGSEQKIKWKKLITSALKSNPNGTLKMKKLQKLVWKSLQESGVAVDDSDFRITLEHKVNSSSKYSVDSKYVRLVA